MIRVYHYLFVNLYIFSVNCGSSAGVRCYRVPQFYSIGFCMNWTNEMQQSVTWEVKSTSGVRVWYNVWKKSKEITLYLLLSLLIASYLDTWQCCYGCGFANQTIHWFVTMIVAKWRGPPLISRRKRFSRSIIKELQHDVMLIEECKVRKKRWV